MGATPLSEILIKKYKEDIMAFVPKKYINSPKKK
jgi:hypothetical protein